MGGISEIAYGFPGYDGIIPRSTATVAEILRLNGYSTAMFGKAHVTPMWETSPAGPFDRWPTGLGFERFYGFLGGEASQWEPALYDQTTPIEPYVGRDDYHLTEDLADRTIEWMRLQKAAAPDKPFFVYFSPGATHAPHHVWPEWIEQFRGRFDERLGRPARGDPRPPAGAGRHPGRDGPDPATGADPRLGRVPRSLQARGPAPDGGLRRLPGPHRCPGRARAGRRSTISGRPRTRWSST